MQVTSPIFAGLAHGHTGHVRFLTSVEMLTQSPPEGADGLADRVAELARRRQSMSVLASTMATKMLVISGGDGYEDFSVSSNSETAGRDDSTNHLLLWQV